MTGRICCDSDGRLNSKSIVIQGSQDVCLGRSIPVDAMKLSDYPLFPGQIIAAEVINPTGKKLIATKHLPLTSRLIQSFGDHADDMHIPYPSQMV